MSKRELLLWTTTLALSGCYMHDASVGVKPIVNGILVEKFDGKYDRFQFWVGAAAAERLGNPPYDNARALALEELKRRGQCPNGVRVLPATFHNPGTFGLAFVAECL